VVLWAGGVYDWLDPVSAIEAVDVLRHRRPDVRLVFQGMRHPNADVVPMAMPDRCRALADERGLTGEHVFFLDWVPYEERHDYLLDADVGLCTHPDHLESEFAFRTRVLDYLWAGLPVVVSAGDELGALVAAEGLGAVVRPGDTGALADALEALLYDEQAIKSAAAHVARVRDRFTWSSTLAPLVDFCAAPKRAADAVGDQLRIARRPVLPTAEPARLAARAGLALRRGGLKELWRAASRRLGSDGDRLGGTHE